eukprot:GFYU01010187.1.p1 GENE.GFYU01010187.1~~GFYU01010187.1.p1  ORF type:complete len:876 (-),score=358.18 GFYU01010187.1:132-2759(-)
MPLLKRKPYTLAKKPSGLKAGEEVYVNRVTKEIFKSYEEYLKKFFMYIEKQWTCKATGKTMLTFEQALQSERKAEEDAEKCPIELVEPLLRWTHGDKRNTEELIEYLNERLKTYFVPEEIVQMKKGSLSTKVMIVDLLDRENVLKREERPENDAESGSDTNGAANDEGKAGKDASKKKVDDSDADEDVDDEVTDVKLKTPKKIRKKGDLDEDDDNEDEANGDGLKTPTKKKTGSTPKKTPGKSPGKGGKAAVQYYFPIPQYKVKAAKGKGEVETVSGDILHRSKPVLPKAWIKRIVKLHAAKPLGKEFWIVSGQYADQFELEDLGGDTSSDSDSDDDSSSDDGSMQLVDSSDCPIKTKKAKEKKRKHKDSEDQPKKRKKNMTPEQETAWEEEKARRKEEREKAREQARLEKAALKAQQNKYPMEDTELSPQELGDLPKRPHGSTDFEYFPEEHVGDALMVYDFLHTFRKVLKVSGFSFEDLAGAMLHPSECMLTNEIHVRILFRLMEDIEIEKARIAREDVKLPKNKIPTHDNWPTLIKDYLLNPALGADEEEDEDDEVDEDALVKLVHSGYRGLDLQERLSLLKCVCDDVLDTDIVRNTLDEMIETQANIRRERWMEETEERKRIKELEAERKAEEAAALAKKEEEGDESNKENTDVNGNAKVKDEEPTKTFSHVDSIPKLDESLLNRRELLAYKQQIKQAEELDRLAKLAEEKKIQDAINAERRKKDELERAKAEEEDNKTKRAEYYEKELAKHTTRTQPLGRDRDFNRYWLFDGIPGRIFIQTRFNRWSFLSSMEDVDSLFQSLCDKGIRERALLKALEKNRPKIVSSMKKRQQQIERQLQELAGVRRSGRLTTQGGLQDGKPFLQWVNKFS